MIAPAIDLKSLIESRAPTRLTYSHVRTDGGVYTGICPFPGCSSKNDAFHVWPNSERPRYWCRVCGRSGDAISFLRDYSQFSYRQALEELSIQEKTYALPPTHMTGIHAPSKIWQETCRGFCHMAETALWSKRGEMALCYVRGRGLSDETIREAGLGYCPGIIMAGEQWGIQTKQVIIPRGITIPWWGDDQLWKVTLRLGKSSPNRYTQVLGSQECLFNTDKIADKTTVLYEGVFDALSGQQAAPELTHVATDDVHKCRGARWIVRLCTAPRVLVAYDADEAGDREAAFWTRTLPHASRWRPWAKDASTMLEQGLDVRLWLALGNASMPDTSGQTLQDEVWDLAAAKGFPAMQDIQAGEEAYLGYICSTSLTQLFTLKKWLEGR